RQHLGRLTGHDPAREVTSVMTNELFFRLTDAHPAPLTSPPGARRYTYTPRKVLRRVLDHALDHLNQIGQWLTWRRDGVVPIPTHDTSRRVAVSTRRSEPLSTAARTHRSSIRVSTASSAHPRRSSTTC